MTEDEMVGWHHQLGHEFDQASGVGDGQGSLACCSPRGCKEFDTTELNRCTIGILTWGNPFLFECRFITVAIPTVSTIVLHKYLILW